MFDRAAPLVLVVAWLSAGAPLAGCRRPGATARAGDGAAMPAAPGPAVPGSAPAAVAPPPRGTQIVIAYSSNLLGEYEPCG